MRTRSMSTPKADAAICASPMFVPAMSTWPVRTLRDPSGLSRTVAPVGWSPGIQPPSARPLPRSPPPVLAPTGRPLVAVLPERVLTEPAQHLLRAVALPGLAVRHRIALLHEMP